MKKSTRERGTFAEKIAEEYLKKTGFKILGKNFRTKEGEIDLIAQKGHLLVFIEVKSKDPLKNYPAEEKINFFKQYKIQRVAELYLLKNSENLSKIKEIRFDVVIVDPEKKKVDYYESAFFSENF